MTKVGGTITTDFASLRGGTTKQSHSKSKDYFSAVKRVGYVYILTNNYNTTLYVGVTSDLAARTQKHINKTFSDSFTAKYNLNKLIYWEGFNSIEDAIAREKQIKGGNRNKKEELINSINPEWENLYPKIISGEVEV